MKTARIGLRGPRGFTLVETLVGLAAAATLMATIVACSITLQRSFFWSADYAEQSLAQLRSLDFVTRDVRGARGVWIDGSGEFLTLELPATYASYDPQGNPTSAPVTPVIVRGQPQYGDPAQPVSIWYYRNGDSLIREQWMPAVGGWSVAAVATGIKSFQAQLVGAGNLVRMTVTFLPKLRDGQEHQNRTAMSATVAGRAMVLKWDGTRGGGGEL